MKDKRKIIQDIKKLINVGDTDNAIKKLLEKAVSDRDKDLLVLFNSQYKHFKRQSILGQLSQEDESIRRNKFNHAILEIAKGLEIENLTGIKNKFVYHLKAEFNRMLFTVIITTIVLFFYNATYMVKLLDNTNRELHTRGTATLVQGEVFVEFSQQLQCSIDEATLTVHLTPLYTNTYGLAVSKKTSKGFCVKELMNGNGNFSFDWEIKASGDPKQKLIDHKIAR